MSSAGNFTMDKRMAMHELVPLYQDKHLQFTVSLFILIQKQKNTVAFSVHVSAQRRK